MQISLEHDPDILPYPQCLPSNRNRDSFSWSTLAKRNLHYSLLIQHKSSKEIILSGASVLGQEGKVTLKILFDYELLPQVNDAVECSIEETFFCKVFLMFPVQEILFAT